MTFLRIVIPLYFLFEHDLFGKPVPTFPDHALFDGYQAALLGSLPGAPAFAPPLETATRAGRSTRSPIM
jgi:hypothetical protein